MRNTEEPASASMLKEMLDSMAEIDIKQSPRMKKGIVELLNVLIQHYDGTSNYTLPIKMNEINFAY